MKKQLIFITTQTCPVCVVQREVLKRVLPEFPDIEMVNYDRNDDADKIEMFDIRSVPFLALENKTLNGSHTLKETRQFLRGEFSDADIEAAIKKEHYLDNAATTRVCEEAAQAATEAMLETYGNPSSTHLAGRNAKKLLDNSREKIAAALGAKPSEIVFTSCGSESDNWALIKGAELMKRKGKHIISSSIEHDAIRKTLDALEHDGYEITRLNPDNTGRITPEAVEQALREDTILISLMMVNNETGAVTDIATIAKLLKQKKSQALLHTDAVQGFMKVPFKAKSLGADMISISGHKIHAPKGIGALYIREGLNLKPFIVGGSQESERRAGTESLPLIAAFAVAAEIAARDFDANTAYMQALKDEIITRLSDAIPELVYIKTDAPHILSISLPGFRSEVVMNFLEGRGVYVSKSSACKRGARSHVLGAIGMSARQIDGALRIGLSRMTSAEDIDALCDGIIEAYKILAHE